MSRTYQQVIDDAELLLQDEATDQTVRRWTETELLGWATKAEQEISKLKPDSYPVISTNALAAGSLQSLPSASHQLLDVLSNMGTTGTTRGDVVSVVERKYMNALNPGWMSDTANAVVTHVIYDVKRNPKKYWVYPQSTGTNYLEIMTSDLPANTSKVIGDNIMLGDEYAYPMLHFIVGHAYMKDTDIPQSAALSQAHINMFMQLLGLKEIGEAKYHPKRTTGDN
jgi:hypothetical protein